MSPEVSINHPSEKQPKKKSLNKPSSSGKHSFKIDGEKQSQMSQKLSSVTYSNKLQGIKQPSTIEKQGTKRNSLFKSSHNISQAQSIEVKRMSVKQSPGRPVQNLS